jgi:hypothetical protein
MKAASTDAHESRAIRDAIAAGILSFVGGEDLLTLADIRAALEREIDDAEPDALIALKTRLAADDSPIPGSSAGKPHGEPFMLFRRADTRHTTRRFAAARAGVIGG